MCWVGLLRVWLIHIAHVSNFIDDAEPGISHREFMERLRSATSLAVHRPILTQRFMHRFQIFMGLTRSLLKFYRERKREVGDVFHRHRRYVMDSAMPSPQVRAQFRRSYV